MSLRLITAAETYPLRQRVLRPLHEILACQFPGDESATTFHVGGFSEQQLVAIASIFLEPHTLLPGDHTYQLRGMAVEPERQRCGLGKTILIFAEEEACRRGGQRLWCNARAGVLGFYEHLGFTPVSKVFEIEGIGPHYVCIKPLA